MNKRVLYVNYTGFSGKDRSHYNLGNKVDLPNDGLTNRVGLPNDSLTNRGGLDDNDDDYMDEDHYAVVHHIQSGEVDKQIDRPTINYTIHSWIFSFLILYY